MGNLRLMASNMPRIAVIDDHAEVVTLLTDWLEQLLPGAKISPFSTLQPALDAIDTCDFDLVIADIDLGPGNDKFGGVRIAKALNTQSTPLLVISGTVGETQKGYFKALDAWDTLEKPVDRPDFETLVRRAIAYRRGMSEVAATPAGEFPRVPNLKITRQRGRPVEWKGKTIRLQMSQIDLVEVLAKAAGETVTHATLFGHIPSGKNLDNLRQKISEIRAGFEGEDPAFDRIVTVPLKGYSWRID